MVSHAEVPALAGFWNEMVAQTPDHPWGAVV
jgi:hypothetical protein